MQDTPSPEQIKACRLALGMKMDKFAARLGFTGKDRRSNVSRYESGSMTPHPFVQRRIQQLMKLAERTQ